MSTNDPGKKLRTTREIAERLGVTPDTVLRWKHKRGLPARELTSRAIRYDEDEVQAWIDERRGRGRPGLD